MAKQTFTTGQVLTAAQMTSLQQTAMGGGSTTAKTASYVLVAADAGTVVQMNSASATTITVNTALFAAGDTVQIQNVGAGVCTVTAGTATVSTSATLALKQYDAGSLYFNSTSAAIFFAVDAADGMTNPFTTTGDTVYASGGTTPTRLGIGSTGQVLTVASGIPSWATPSSGSTFSGASVYKNTSQSIATATAVVATWQVEDFDVDNYWSSGAATRLTIPTGKSGKFAIVGRLTYTANATGMRGISLQKNGSTMGGPNVQTVSESGIGVGITASWIDDAVATDYYELVYNQRSGSTLTSEPGGGVYYDIFSIAYLGA